MAKAKVVESLAKAKRIEWEERVAAKIGGPDEGQKTEKLEDGTRVVVKRGYNLKADVDELHQFFTREQLDSPACITYPAPKLDDLGYRWYREHNPEVFAKISKYVTATPKKIAVEIKVKS